jgi:FkbM family methyltransferase
MVRMLEAPLRWAYRSFLARSLPRHWQLSYAQEGEDLVLKRIFGSKSRGFYVDIGAHHPKRFSNTFIFYQRGWHGINVDAMPGSMEDFRRLRPRDVNLEIAISSRRETLTYYMFDEPALNGFDRELCEERIRTTAYRLVGQRPVAAIPLRELFVEYASAENIDFMSIDVEGLDLPVLQSNDWERFRPKVVLVECLDSFFVGPELAQNRAAAFMSGVDYGAFAKTFNTVFFMDRRQSGSG